MHTADEDIPSAYTGFIPEDLPRGHEVEWITMPELRAAGFHRGRLPKALDGMSPQVAVLAVPGVQVFGPGSRPSVASARFLALRRPDGRIVAARDKGRWWTPEESDLHNAARIGVTALARGSSIDGDLRTVDVRARVGGEEEDKPRDLVRGR